MKKQGSILLAAVFIVWSGCPSASPAQTTPEQLLILIRSATIVNLLGQETIKAAAENKICTPENIITIQGVPHAQIFRIF